MILAVMRRVRKPGAGISSSISMLQRSGRCCCLLSLVFLFDLVEIFVLVVVEEDDDFDTFRHDINLGLCMISIAFALLVLC